MERTVVGIDVGSSKVCTLVGEIREGGETYYEAELHRLKGEVTLMALAGVRARPDQAEACFRQAIDVARSHSARTSELRATASLARLWGEQGRAAEAREMLAGIYGWFTEGFATRDLVEARSLLEKLWN